MLKVIQLLVNNNELKKKIGANVYALQTDYLGDCIVYSYHTTQQDKITQHVRLEITIISKTLAKAEEIENIVKKILLTYGDEPLTDEVLLCELNGGGTIIDNGRDMIHRILYFEIIKYGNIQ